MLDNSLFFFVFQAFDASDIQRAADIREWQFQECKFLETGFQNSTVTLALPFTATITLNFLELLS